jgi:prepilin-type processing-associated H-X9-DG protein
MHVITSVESSQRAGGEAGFTRLELLVVACTCALLSCLILGSLSHAQVFDQAMVCQNNMRHLTLGWQLYVNCNGDRLPRTGGMDYYVSDPLDPRAAPGGSRELWCQGIVSYSSSSDGAISTNKLFLERGQIWKYVGKHSSYKCPSDSNNYKGTPVVRSVSMNGWLNPIQPWSPNGKKLKSLGDMIELPPVRTFVIIEENPYSINDTTFFMNITSQPYPQARGLTWVDYPASYHNFSANLSFADGHVEMHRWTDRNMLIYPKGGNAADGADLAWLSSRGTVFVK